ncbi:ABC-2 family transporter protein-domain-containing protein, partial [Tribonema minus]
SYHGLPGWLGQLTELKYRTCLNNEQASYTARTHPLPVTAQESIETQTILSVLACLFIIIPLCYAPAAFVTFVVRERATKSKRLQLMSGASPLSYWLATYLWDVTLFMVLAAACMGCLYTYGQHAARCFVELSESAGAMALLFVLYGFSVLPLCYLYTFMFDNHR